MGVSRGTYFDYAVLKCVHDADRPLWKKRIFEHINDNIAQFPVLEGIAVQTVGRHVDRLHQAGDLESKIISPEDVDREYMIGFTLTEQGKQRLEERRLDVLRTNVLLTVHPTADAEEVVEIEKTALTGLVCDEFGLDDERIRDQLDCVAARDIIGLLAIYYFSQHLRQFSDGGAVNDLVQVIGAIPAMRDEFASDSLMRRLFSAFTEVEEPLLDQYMQINTS